MKHAKGVRFCTPIFKNKLLTSFKISILKENQKEKVFHIQL